MSIFPDALMLFQRRAPRARLLDLVSDVSDLTTYTFSNCNLGEFGSGMTHPTVAGGLNYVRSSTGRVLVAIIHAEDALATFSLTSVTVGGVSMTERADRGGGTNAINTGIYTIDGTALEGASSADVVVTFDEAVTSCAVGLVMLDNVASSHPNGFTATGTGTAATGAVTGATNTTAEFGAIAIIGTTNSTGGGTETVRFTTDDRYSCLGHPVLLYESSNAEIDYAAAFAICNQYPGYSDSQNYYQAAADWSGTNAFDLALAVLR